MTREQLLDLKEQAAAQGVLILTDQEFNDHLAAKAADVTRMTASKLEETVFELTGLQKKPNQKYFDYVKDALSALMEAKKELDALKDKKYDQILQAKEAQLETLRLELQKKEDEHKQKLLNIEQKMFEREVQRSFQAAVSEYVARAKKLDGVNTAEIIQLKAEKALATILSQYTPVRNDAGEFIGFVEKDAQPIPELVLRDAKTKRVLDFSDFLAEHLKDYVSPATQRQVTGAGASHERYSLVSSLLHADRAKVIEVMKQNGIAPTSREGYEFIQRLAKARKESGIT